MSLTWEKEKRILKRPDFSLCYDTGTKIHSKLFLAFIHNKSTQKTPRIGMAVTKKVGNAVMRNRLKRLLREFCRKNQEYFPQNADIVFTPKKHIKIHELDYQKVEDELLGLLKKYE